MTRSYANSGRPMASSFGSLPVVAYSSTVPKSTYGFGGQPGMFTTGLEWMIESTPTASVGFGPLEGTPPHEEQEPMAMTAAEWLATSLRRSNPVLPAILR